MNITDNDLRLFLCFDEDDAYGRAFDYSPHRTPLTDGMLVGNAITTDQSVFGQALAMPTPATDNCIVNQSVLNLAGQWTIAFFAQTEATTLTLTLHTTQPAQDDTITIPLTPITATDYHFVAIQRYSNATGVFYIRIIINTTEVYNAPSQASLPPLQLVVDDNSTAQVSIDDFRAFGRILSMDELIILQSPTDDVEYLLDDVNFKTFGVEVSMSTGLIDGLTRKEIQSADWDDYHGIQVDLRHPRYETRQIQLECFIVALDNFHFEKQLRLFLRQFQASGLRRLCVQYSESPRYLVYDIYMDENVEISKRWNDRDMIGTFKIVLVEPSPVKRILRHTFSTETLVADPSSRNASFTITTPKKFYVTWGDGSFDTDISGTSQTITHTYTEPGYYDIILHGPVEEITHFVTDEITVWNRL